jgi:hypothetical protein
MDRHCAIEASAPTLPPAASASSLLMRAVLSKPEPSSVPHASAMAAWLLRFAIRKCFSSSLFGVSTFGALATTQ